MSQRPDSDELATSRTMPEPAVALGSLAAVAAWLAAEQADATPVISTSVVNVPVTNGGFIDIDGDSTNDFQFTFNNSQVLKLQAVNGANGSARSATLDGFNQSYYTLVLTSGSTVDGSLTYAPLTTMGDSNQSAAPAATGAFIAGVKFIGADTFNHYGWVNFTFPNNVTPWAGALAVSAGWETTPDTAITAVPEPAAITLGALGLVCCLVARRVRRVPSPRR